MRTAMDMDADGKRWRAMADDLMKRCGAKALEVMACLFRTINCGIGMLECPAQRAKLVTMQGHKRLQTRASAHCLHQQVTRTQDVQEMKHLHSMSRLIMTRALAVPVRPLLTG